ncbi:MAG: hypothetical protein HY708_04340 [Ignavibacteriae bacterium]|nr:hypothetical protein [Ignavibacteriota bacterium]
MEEKEKAFKYKLDFYYQSALIYLVTLILYVVIRGNLVEKRFEYVLDDPLLYVIVFFVMVSFITLGLNYIRNRRLIVQGDTIVFKNKFHERRVDAKDIEWIYVGRETRVQTSGRFQVIVFKLRKKRRLFRIRVGRYEKEKELIQEINRIAAHLPKRKHPRWRRPRITDR